MGNDYLLNCVCLQILAALPYEWNGVRLLFFSCIRVVFIPLFIMCVYPVPKPTLCHPAWPCVFSLLMGITNGYFGSVPMIQAAGKVPPEQRELAGKADAFDQLCMLMIPVKTVHPHSAVAWVTK